jgi:hypothetical protein
MHINNTQFSLLEASEDFMSSALILLTGIFTDRLGGTGCIVYGNTIYTIGSILIAGAAETRSYKFMIVGRVVASFGDIATQVAQYKVFSSWFPPNAGFASTLGFELGIKKVFMLDGDLLVKTRFTDVLQIGGFVGKSTANIIAKVRASNILMDRREMLMKNRTELRLLKRLLDNGRHESLHQCRHHLPLLPGPLLLFPLLLNRRPGHWRKTHRKEQISRL